MKDDFKRIAGSRFGYCGKGGLGTPRCNRIIRHQLKREVDSDIMDSILALHDGGVTVKPVGFRPRAKRLNSSATLRTAQHIRNTNSHTPSAQRTAVKGNNKVGDILRHKRNAIDVGNLAKSFAAIGARLKVVKTKVPSELLRQNGFTIDVKSDKRGEFFELLFLYKADIKFDVLQVRRGIRHLLLCAGVTLNAGNGGTEIRPRHFLCGRDESHWFVAETKPATSVKEAKEALKPDDIFVSRIGLSKKHKTAAIIRQGEWFFVPCPSLKVDHKTELYKNEPFQMGGRKAHFAESLYRSGGELVYVCEKYPNGLTEAEYSRLIGGSNMYVKLLKWCKMYRNAGVFVRGRIWHADHKTLVLPFWHRVIPNAERRSGNVAFLD